MTVSTPDIQALIEEANRQVGHIADKSKREQLIADLAAALSALSGETETEWEYDAKPDWEGGIRWSGTSLDDHLANIEKYSDPRSGWWYADAGDAADRPEVINYTVRRRRKAGPWIEVV